MRRALPLSLALLTGFVCAAPAMGRQAPESELSRIQAEYRDEAVRARRLRADADAAKTALSILPASDWRAVAWAGASAVSAARESAS